MANYAWHFVRLADGVPTLRDGRPMPAAGEWLEHTGEVAICAIGLHASWQALDALAYAPLGDLAACLVEVDAIVAEQDDKFVCRRRRVIAWSPCDDVLRLFARECALSVLHLWSGEVPAVVREYLETGNEEIRAAARAAACDAAAWDDAACDAARAAAWDAAACDAARAAAWDAAWDAACDAARAAAARAAARAAAISEMSIMLESMLLAELEVDFD